MSKNHRQLSLQTTITLLVFTVVALALLVTDILISVQINEYIEEDQAEKATQIARIVARSPVIVEGLTGLRDEGEIQRFANEIRETTGVQFIVVMDMHGIRKSHPDPSKVGKPFVGGDEAPVLSGHEHISIAKGTLGLSLRSFTPIVAADGQQVGAAAVGISLEKIERATSASLWTLFLGIGFGGMIGLIGAILLARKIKKILFGLEPSAIAKLLQERNAILHSTKEGILAVDQEAKISLVNDEAIRLFKLAGITNDLIGTNVQDYLSGSSLIKVMETGQAELDQELTLEGMTLLVNTVPVHVDGKVVGAVATFRDKTEIKLLVEQLSGVQTYADALRAQAHEFMNKLHVILGMVEVKYYDRLADYIKQITHHHQNEIGFVMRKIKDPVLAGFVLGKLSYSREVDVKLKVTGDYWPEPANGDITHDIITILGNLIDNAMDAVQGCAEKEVQVNFQVKNNALTLEVKDTGLGIPDETKAEIYMKGFSTKGDNRGLGLFLIKESIKRLGGSLELESQPGNGTTFKVTIPYQLKGDDDD
ncbi:DcuS/MalK family sensor histidine kinase [Ammoniphilus sp. 3BR4]|uniref:DcuS/MalK family sensor histidine kinase n=1 Tax=Ammoniphilus sp. 3BR4 TaxID=3158265 RepID=UPI00346529F8